MSFKPYIQGGKVLPSTFLSNKSHFLNIKYGIKLYKFLHNSLYLEKKGNKAEKEDTGRWSVLLGTYCTQQRAKETDLE